MSKFYKQNGITLVSMMLMNLIIIMVGTVIAYNSSQNGILTPSAEAQETNEQESIEEKIKLAVNATLTNNISENNEFGITLNELNEELAKHELGPAEEDGSGGFILNVGSDVYNISKDGNVTLAQDN